MANETFAGPVNYVVFGFPGDASIGAGLEAILERVDTGIVEILDVEYIEVDETGVASATAITEHPNGDQDFAEFGGVLSNLLDDEDLAQISDSLQAGWFAIAVVYEDRSLAVASDAFAKAGGVELLSGGVDIIDLADVVEKEV